MFGELLLEYHAMRMPQSAPSIVDLFASIDLNDRLPVIFGVQIGPAVNGEYRHWDEIRHQTPPAGLDRREWWLGIKMARNNVTRELPLRATDGSAFRYCLTDEALGFLHWIDQHSAGEILVSEGITDAADRGRYVVSSQIEEAITSSQLEGATATRKVAKDMLRSGRPPRDRSERMILNNFRAMSRIREFAAQDLTPELVYELHRVLTEQTLDDPSAAGRPQRPGEVRVRVTDPDGQVVHVPPNAEELDDRLAAMCAFANDTSEAPFMHPVIRAILLHLWLAYDHPFEDGNGRTARALFYWSMLHRGYWMFEFLSISSILRGAPSQYARAFLLTETDDDDATYFLLYQLRVIQRAVTELIAYLRRKVVEVRQTVRLLRNWEINHRQVALLTHALRHSDAEYTARSHASSHRVTEQSARTDLLDLEDRELLVRRKVGKRFVFSPVAELAERLAAT
jgi:Fic family protein